jgi:hypothetical protein
MRFATRLGITPVLLFSASVAVVTAQWFGVPTPNLPRTPEGRPDLTLPVKRMSDGKPDLSGVWRFTAPRAPEVILENSGPSEWVTKAREAYLIEEGRNDTALLCLPHGTPRRSMGVEFAKFVQTPELLMVLYEDLSYRQIFLDSRSLPVDPNPSWMGYSVGRWDGDRLVVTSIGFTERSFLSDRGHKHSESLRLTERFTRRNIGTMDVEVTVEDTGAFSKTAIVSVNGTLAPDTELLEYVCENERSRARIASGAGPLQLPPDVLARYAGTFEFRRRRGPERLVIEVRDGRLLFTREDGRQEPAIPVSETMFNVFGASFRFIADVPGRFDRFIGSIVEGDAEGVRISN